MEKVVVVIGASPAVMEMIVSGASRISRTPPAVMEMVATYVAMEKTAAPIVTHISAAVKAVGSVVSLLTLILHVEIYP